MNKQRKVLITITYNELGIIIDTKAEEIELPNLQSTCNQLATDTISRQQAIDAINRAVTKEAARWSVEELPPVQPQQILYANMSDAEFEKWLYEHGICNPSINESIPCTAIPLLIDSAINNLSSTQPTIEPRIGHWIASPGMNEQCSTCGKYFPVSSFAGRPFEINYCPHCGVKMEVRHERRTDT